MTPSSKRSRTSRETSDQKRANGEQRHRSGIFVFRGLKRLSSKSRALQNRAEAADHFLKLDDDLLDAGEHYPKLLGASEQVFGTLRFETIVESYAPGGSEQEMSKWLLKAGEAAIRSPDVVVIPPNLPPGLSVSAIFTPAPARIRAQNGKATPQRKKPLDPTTVRDDLRKGTGDETQRERMPSGQQIQDSLPFKDFDDAEKALVAAIKQAKNAMKGEGSIDEACDSFTAAARSFAALVLAERVEKYFDSMQASEARRPSEAAALDSFEKKSAVAHRVREWLAPWNLGFSHAEGGVYQLFATSGGPPGATSGRFRLSRYGASGTRKEIDAWADVITTVAKPELGDVTAFYRR